MIKYYCDICGKEIQGERHTVVLSYHVTNGISLETCLDCVTYLQNCVQNLQMVDFHLDEESLIAEYKEE